MEPKDIVDQANRFMSDDNEKEITKDQMEQMAIAIRQNTNFNHDATQPYTPAEEYQFHKVTYRDRSNNLLSFVCSNYQIKEQMITFYDVRVRAKFVQNEVIPKVGLKFEDNWGDVSTLRTNYVSPSSNSFSVDGYKQTDCKTIIREKLEDIDSFAVVPGNTDWYGLTEEMAIEQSSMKVESYNERVTKQNEKVLGEEFLQNVYDEYVRKHQNSKVNDIYNKYRDSNWFMKLFRKKPTEDYNQEIRDSITKPNTSFFDTSTCRYKDAIENYPELKQYDWSTYIRICGNDDAPKPEEVNGDVIDAEFEEVE